MRRRFSKILEEIMGEDPNIHLVTADLGYGMFDSIKEKYPTRFHNVGAAEQLMMLTAIGLSLSGKKPITYTISPFYWRCAEMIRNYVNEEQIPILMVGSGRDKDYAHDGFSHDASDVDNLFKCFANIAGRTFHTESDVEDHLKNYKWSHPWYLNLKR